MQLGEIEPLALTQALVAALAGVSGASVPSPLAQGPSGADLGRGASAQIQTHSSGVPEEAAKPEHCTARIILQRRGAAQPVSACACCGVLHAHLSRARAPYVARTHVTGSGERFKKRNNDKS